MIPYLFLFLSGLLVFVGSFAFAAWTTTRRMQSFFENFAAAAESPLVDGRGDGEKPLSMFHKNTGAVAFMILGGLLAAASITLAVCRHFNIP